MTKKEIAVLSWDQAAAKFPKNHANQGIFDGLKEINASLKEEERFVYYTKYEFGEKIIHKGRLLLDDYEVAANQYKKSINDFKNDVGYSNDPLAIILTNYVEVYTENTCDEDSYPVPLNIIRAGDIFGVFGTLDLLTGCSNIENIKERDWYVVAGNVSFHIAFPFENQGMEDLIGGDGQPFYRKTLKYSTSSKTDRKIGFIKEHVKDWCVEIVYIPKHYLEKLKTLNLLYLENLLFKKGWQQSSPLRYAVFEDSTISDVLSTSLVDSINHDKIFLYKVYMYLLQCFSSPTFVYKPILGNQHIVSKAIEEFKTNNKRYFQRADAVEPLPFASGILEPDGWGILSYYHLPIIYNYHPLSLTKLIKDLEIIRTNVPEFLPSRTRYLLSHIYAFGNQGVTSNIQVQPRDEIRRLIATTFDVPMEKVNLSSKDFKNIILIKNENGVS